MDLSHEIKKFTSAIEDHIRAEIKARTLKALDSKTGEKGWARFGAVQAKVIPDWGRKASPDSPKDGRARRRCRGCNKLGHDLRNCDAKKGKQTKAAA